MTDATELSTLWVALAAYLPAGSLKAPEDNAAAYVSYVDPRKAPINVDVFDLRHDIVEALRVEDWGSDEERDDYFHRLAYRARRLMGQIAPPVRVVTPCPVCGSSTIFRVDTDAGLVAACCNPACRDEEGRKHQWSEQEWQDIQDSLRRSFTVGDHGEHLG